MCPSQIGGIDTIGSEMQAFPGMLTVRLEEMPTCLGLEDSEARGDFRDPAAFLGSYQTAR